MKDVSRRFLQVPVNMVDVGQKLTIYRNAACLGEWPETKVRDLYADGLLFPTDYCWREGMKEWEPLDQFIKHGQRLCSILFHQG